MAKTPSGLPDSFDLNVTASDLEGRPASLPGYLDEDPVLAFANLQREQARKRTEEPRAIIDTVRRTEPAQRAAYVETKPTLSINRLVETPAAVVTRPVPVPVERKRFQINLDVESERMLEEILDLLSSQSSENRIKTSELFQALLMTLYSAKGEIVLGSLPTRGRWGSATAKAFPVNLAEVLREAIVAHERASGGNPFRKVVGG